MVFQNGDFRFFYLENIKDFVTFPTAWDSSLNTGLGHSQLSSLWITSYFNFTSFFTKLGLDWNLIQILFWILPAFFISFFSSFSLFNYLFKEKKYSILSGIIYSLNTYFLMILTGGQLGVSLSYSLVPLVLLRFIKVLENPSLKNSILAGLVLSLQIIFDPRIVYITLVAVLIYLFFPANGIPLWRDNLSKLRTVKNKLPLFTPFIIAVFLNSFWILPLILTKTSPIPVEGNNLKSFEFFSFADFSHSISLLHPNWPENIFGKIYFLDPKFLILPLVAFSSLLFAKNKNILYFSLLSLLGVFLAKGANPPFGEVDTWIFSNFPGMSMFRDPTKWYTLIALSYSILIPFSILKISERFNDLNHFIKNIKISNIILSLFVIYLLFLIRPIGDKKFTTNVGQEYVEFKNFLVSQPEFFRTLWIPKWQRFGFFSNNHPAIGREELLKGNAKKQISELNQNLLRDLSVRYIIVPYDSESEMFLRDRKYDARQYEETVRQLRKVEWLKEVNGFAKVHIFELSNPKDHFWSSSKDLRINYSFVSPTEYKVQLTNAKKGNSLVFSEAFDKNWTAKGLEFRIQSSKFENILNSFNLPKDGTYELKVYYEPQKYVEGGMLISLTSLLVLLALAKESKKW